MRRFLYIQMAVESPSTIIVQTNTTYANDSLLDSNSSSFGYPSPSFVQVEEDEINEEFDYGQIIFVPVRPLLNLQSSFL